MKRFRFFIVGGLALAALSCGPARFQGVVKAHAMLRNEIILTDDLKTLLRDNPVLKVVFRVPRLPESGKWNRYLAIIEKVFVENGYSVPDRALLENLMKTEHLDYQAVLKRIDADLIVDIIALEFNIPSKVFKYHRSASQREERLPAWDNYVDCSLARMECRLTLVGNAKLGGVFTLFTSRCDLEELEIVLDKKGYVGWAKDKGGPIHKSLMAPMETEEQRQRAVRILALRMVLKLGDVRRDTGTVANDNSE